MYCSLIGWRRVGLSGLVIVQQLSHLPARHVQVRAEPGQHLGGDAIPLVDEAEQDVLGADRSNTRVPRKLSGLARFKPLCLTQV
jgi:hypothetical protein